MTADDILTRTFAEHEHLAPDADATLAAVTERLTRPRRTGSVLAAAAAAAVVVVGATVVLHRDPAPPLPAAAPRSVAPAAPAAPRAVSLAAGWLPGPATRSLVSAGYGAEARRYEIADARGATSVLLTAGTGAAGDPKLGPPRPTTIGGRPAREWTVPGRYAVVLRAPDGRPVQVDVWSYATAGGVARPAVTVAAIGRRIAEHLRLDRPEPLRPAFRLGYAPPGLPIRAVSVDPLTGTAYELAPAGATAGHPTLIVRTLPAGGTDTAKGSGPSRPGAPVDGHPTTVRQTGSGPTLLVQDVVPGTSILLTPDQTRGPDLPTLYRIATSLTWTG